DLEEPPDNEVSGPLKLKEACRPGSTGTKVPGITGRDFGICRAEHTGTGLSNLQRGAHWALTSAFDGRDAEDAETEVRRADEGPQAGRAAGRTVDEQTARAPRGGGETVKYRGPGEEQVNETSRLGASRN
ncbi:hypothetical protein F442_07158, partial [Phytophthora nicotianae P10297]